MLANKHTYRLQCSILTHSLEHVGNNAEVTLSPENIYSAMAQW